jgi:hypothetical protein
MSTLSAEEGRAVQEISYYWTGPGPSSSPAEMKEWEQVKSTVRRIPSRDIVFLLQLLKKLTQRISTAPPPR